ncbi:TIGR04104 family putative zinc finger protein [Bacillus sp. es.036]|uniref:TIGR04104 family putative zinc finger protein n=1 Tax=Bacillus sp. es.036 TaxID=1761764 RepID=UPI000BF78809|nr:CXXC-20-CXXC protein [Bacillus sp. es.036]
MPKCKNCGYSFKWNELIMKMLGINHLISGIFCPSCSAPHYLQLRKSRFIPFFLLFQVYMIVIILYGAVIPLSILIGGCVAFFIMLVLFYPFMIKLSYGKHPDL